MTTLSPLLSALNLSRTVGPPPGKRIIDDFTFDFFPGNIYTILGPSGAGKSSLLRLINRLDEPTGGEIIFQGKKQPDYSPCELRCRIGYLFQTPHLFPGSVADNIGYASPSLLPERLAALIEQVHLDGELLTGTAERLSLGEKQRVALARLLATDPTIVLLDEPTSALDPSHTAGIENLIGELVRERSLTVIMVTHHPEQALRMGGDSLLLVAGRLIEYGPAKQIVERPQTELGRRFKDKVLR